MGNNEGWAQPNGLMPNGLLPEEADFVFRPIDSERWSKAEERTAQLIDCIQPDQPSEERRNAVAVYVQRLITRCFPCQVFTFGSVPLKTYLPDGDIDLSAFSENQNMDTWANQVRDTLESEEKDLNAEFRVKEVQYIQAEVKLIKCLVENIVVDISFNQLGGLCTLCFLEEVDHLINQNHLFKRSIILIKAWCYYESRLLGAHHGLISTYALETLVLYIFHVFNNSFAGPLEVLYRFLEFFSKFDWDNFCLSLWGPIPVTSLPDMTAEPPRKDSGELLLSKLFLDACSLAYAVFPGGQESQAQPFVSKYFNVIDPLRINNNLGRSVSKGNFYRIRGAFAYGAKRLATLLKSPKEEQYNEVNDFFTNTWDRHSNGSRPDAPSNNLSRLRLSPNPDHREKPETVDNKSVSKIINKKPSSRHTEVEMKHVSSQYGTNYAGKRQRSLVARTHSSPELTDTLSGTSFQGRRHRASGSGKIHISAAGLDAIRKNLGSEISATQNNIKSVIDDPSSESKSIQNSYEDDSDSVSVIENPSFTIGTRGMLQEEQDLVNMMSTASAPGFNGQVHMPMNFAPPHFRLPLSQSILASMGYPQRNFTFPPIKYPWDSNMPFPPGVVPSPMAHYYSGMRLASNPENFIDTDSGKYGSVVLSTEDTENGVWQELDDGSTSGVDMDNDGLEIISSDDHREDRWSARENRLSTREDHLNSSRHPENRGNEVYLDDRIVIPEKIPNVRTRSSSKTSSESSWDGTSTKASKAIKENRGIKTAPSIVASSVHGKGKTAPEHFSYHGDESDIDSMNELAVRSNGPPMNVLGHPITSSERAETSVSDSVGPGSRHRATDNLTFYPTGPPVPFITMLPIYNYPTDNSESGQSIDSSVVASVKAAEEHKSDILHSSDFVNHWQNLQYGRFCQNPQYYRPIGYPSPVPPMYLQGRNPWDGPGRPSSTNMNAFNQIMSYGPRFVPVAPLQPVSNRPSGVYQRHGDEMPRYRSGTGTYLPNHKASARDRHPTGPRRGNYSYDRSEHHGDRSDREDNWNTNSKARSSGRSHSQSHTERSNGPLRLKSSHSDSMNVPHGVYPNGVSSNGHTVMMLYPYDQHGSYGARAEQLEFGSLEQINEVSHLSEGSRESRAFEEQRFHNSSVQRSSSDQPSSPVIQRRL